MDVRDIILLERTSIEEQERMHRVRLPGRNETIAFGFNNGAWQQLIDTMEEGDELWTFTNSPETWENLAGRSGVALVRRDEVIRTLVTLMS